MDIKELRSMTGMSQRKFADYFGIPVRTVQEWEQGRRVPPAYLVRLMKRILNSERFVIGDLDGRTGIIHRETFKKIIVLRSARIIDKRRGNYRLPDGRFLLEYVTELVDSQMQIDRLGILSDGNLCFCIGGSYSPETEQFMPYTLMPIGSDIETCSFDEMEWRKKRLINEIIT